MTTTSSLIEFKEISKSFGSKIANENVTFSVQAGTIHAIVGENGAGKSTIMKMLFGLYEPDQGEIFLNGIKVQIKNPAIAKNYGIGMVHQHFMLAGPISALDHVILEMTPESLDTNAFLPLPRSQIRYKLESLASSLQMPVDWNSPIEKLPVGIQQRIEILKLLFNNSDILILDEPTAVLTPQEIDEFLSRLQKIRAHGKTILLITHKLKEVFSVADTITVFRKGQVVRTGPVTQWNETTLAEDMIGEPFHELKVSASKFAPQSSEFALEFKTPKINFTLKQGEILGVAGVEGNGQSQIIQQIINPLSRPLSERKDCEVYLNGKLISKMTNRNIRAAGLGYLAEDRHSKASCINSSLFENFLLGQQNHFQKWGLIKSKALKEAFTEACNKFDVQFQNGRQMLSELSGGNQQKLVIARELLKPLKALIAAHPTRGVDIQAIKKIHQSFLEIRDEGTGILLISSELEELMKLSDRIVVLFRGEIVKEFKRSDFNDKAIGAAMAGFKS